MNKSNFLLILGLCLIVAACGNHGQAPADNASFDSVAEALQNDGR